MRYCDIPQEQRDAIEILNCLMTIMVRWWGCYSDREQVKEIILDTIYDHTDRFGIEKHTRNAFMNLLSAIDKDAEE